MAASQNLSRQEARRTIKALSAAIAAGYGARAGTGKRSYKGVAREALGIGAGGLDTRIASISRQYPDMIIPTPAAPAFAALAKPTNAHEIERQRWRAIDSEKTSALKETRAELVRLQDDYSRLKWAANSSPAPADWTFRGVRVGGQHIPVLFTSDFQIGEVIRPQETDNAHGYSTQIFRKRYRKLIETTIALCQEHTGSSWKFPGIVYLRGGDTISGAIHQELAETDDVTPIEACRIAAEEEAAGIEKLADAFGKVDVKDVGGGNHDRSTFKPRSKRASAHSYDALVGFMLRQHFRNDKRVTFQATESPDVFFPLYDRNQLLTHGDKIGSRGGEGFIGPVATIARGGQKVIMEQQALGRSVDRVWIGHFHCPMEWEWMICNGCLPGYSEYAKLNRMRPSPPSQYLVFNHPKYGPVDHKLIMLEERVRAPASFANGKAEQRLIKAKAA